MIMQWRTLVLGVNTVILSEDLGLRGFDTGDVRRELEDVTKADPEAGIMR